MPYYPILKVPGFHGWTTLCNYPPNNWETSRTASKFINITWSDNDKWKTNTIDRIEPYSSRTITEEEVSDYVPEDSLPFLSLSTEKPEADSDVLPAIGYKTTAIPAWRATLGLSTKSGSTSYQGEIVPFPENGTLLSFCPFMQYGSNIENYLVLVNLERSPIQRKSEIEIYNTKDTRLMGRFEFINNNITTINLDNLGFDEYDLPLIISKDTSAIPLYLTKTTDGKYISFEHTHAPASYVVHGNRWKAQSFIKKSWFEKVKNNNVKT